MSDSRTPGLSCLEYVLVDPVDHGGGLGEKDDLVGALDLPGHHHRLLAVGDLETGRLEGEEHGRLRHVDPERLAGHAVVGEGGGDLRCRSLMEPGLGADGALEPGVAADRVGLVVQPGELQPVRLGRRTEVPDPRRALACDQRPALPLVERPVADVGRRGVADVGRLEQKQRPQLEAVEDFANPGQTVIAQSVEVDPVLPVDRHRAWRRGGRHRKLGHRPSSVPSAAVQCY